MIIGFVMIDHEKLKAILKSEGLNYHDIAKITGHSYGSVKNMLQPNKPVPRWLKLLIHIYNEL